MPFNKKIEQTKSDLLFRLNLLKSVIQFSYSFFFQIFVSNGN